MSGRYSYLNGQTVIENRTGCSWLGWMYALLDKELAEWPITESDGEWS